LNITIITYKIASTYDLQVIKNYVKSVNCIDTTSVEVPCLLQSKSYLKIIGILYYQEDSLNPITLKVVEDIIKQNQIFDNIVLMSKLYVIKVFPRLDIAIVWLDIWDIQSSSKTKGLINQYFNVRNYIATIRRINMNLGVLQYKNCWKWSHVTFSYKIQGAKCVKCNSLHKLEYYCQFVWYCKVNNKMNLPCLETKKSEPCLHLFKYANCQDNYQADSN